MAQLSKRHKTILLTLGIYWPLIFWLTHIPVPDVARQSGMSDKTMHVLAYLVLTFFGWLAVKPYEKVHWKRPAVWIILVAVVLYGAIDEWLQGRVGRSADIEDFFANLLGVVLGLGLLSILSFWPALLSLSAAFIFIVSNLSTLTAYRPELHLDTFFHFSAYTIFTLIWIQNLGRLGWLEKTTVTNLFPMIVLPLGLLTFVKISGIYLDRELWWVDIATAVFGICSTALVSCLVTLRPKSTAPSR